MTDKELQDLISLKRYEQPDEEYFDKFLEEFQQRQRTEMLNTSARGLLLERAKDWFTSIYSTPILRYAIVGSAACLALFVSLTALQNASPSDQPLVKNPTNTKNSANEELLGYKPTDLNTNNDSLTALAGQLLHPIDFNKPTFEPPFTPQENIF